MAQGRNRPSPFILLTRKVVNNDQLVMTLLAVVVGACVGGLAILFVEKIDFFQSIFLGISGAWIADHIAQMPPWKVILTPTLGGLLVGFIVYRFLGNSRTKGPADVIAACEVGGAQMSLKEGLWAALSSGLSISSGASVGREGPVVHLGGSFAAWVGGKLQLSRSNARILLGCGVAAAVSASFNAPIAGALFAQEVILSHYALKAFAPVVIASISGTVIAHQVVGNVTAFQIQAHHFGSYLEFPAFAGLGIVSGFVGVLFVWSILKTQKKVQKIPLPVWAHPAIGGFCVGVIALWYPEVLGVGYEATDNALKGSYGFALLLGLFIFKFVATVLSLGFGFAGGVFSPSLVIGAMLGGTYGIIVGELYPDLWSGVSAYSLIGMASMAAAVLGAPISTTLIVFELTGNYSLTIAVMCACVLATLVNDQLHRQSFFLEQLKERGIDLGNTFSTQILKDLKVSDILRREGEYVAMDASLKEVRKRFLRAPGGVLYVIAHDRSLYGAITWEHMPEDVFDANLNDLVVAADIADTRPPVLQTSDTLEVAKAVLEEINVSQIAVVSPELGRAYMGCIDERELMAAYNAALLKKRKQEQGG